MTDTQLVPLTTDARPEVSRRGVLRAAGLSGAAVALLAACGGGEASSGGTPSTPATASPGGGGSPGGGALVSTADVPLGGGVILAAEKVVVTQPSAGTFKAFTAICTHQGCTVASVEKDKISCACHGSGFSAKDGSVVNGPATRPLKEIAVTVEGDQVVQS